MRLKFFSPAIKKNSGFTQYIKSENNFAAVYTYRVSYAGFTLLELLVVIFVIGLLATTVVIRIDQVRQQARDVRRVVDLIQLSNALELYYSDHNAYPKACGDVVGSFRGHNECGDAPYIADMSNYISRLPIDPSGTEEVGDGYLYYVSGDADNQQHYKLVAENTVEEDVALGDPFARCSASCDTAVCIDDRAVHTYGVYTPGFDESADELVECL